MVTFKKNERLANFRLRTLLFKKGKLFFQYPVRVIYLCMPREKCSEMFSDKQSVPASGLFPSPAKCLIGVSGRQIKGAVDRNHLKRLVKEAYRQNKSQLYSFLEKRNAVCMLALIYAVDKKMPYAAIENSVQKSLLKLQEKIEDDGLQELHASNQN